MKAIETKKSSGMKMILAILLVFVVFACSDNGGEDTPASDQAKLIDFTVDATTDFNPVKTYIDEENKMVYVFSSVDFNSSAFPLTLVPRVTASEGASVSTANFTFSDPEDSQQFSITSENGANTVQYVVCIRDRQLPNAGFENWFQEIGMNSKPFEQPGKYAETTIWATANMGTSIYSIYGTSPVREAGNTLVKIETVETVAIPLVAGALYVGKFDLDAAIADPTNPVAAAIMGMPFYGKPTGVRFQYTYKPGPQMIQATLKDPGNLFGGFDISNIDGTDKMGISVALEKREGDTVTELAKTEFQSDQEVTELTTLKLDLNYTSGEQPTHMYISFSPSFDGGTFKGAVGSTLIIDNIELLYE